LIFCGLCNRSRAVATATCFFCETFILIKSVRRCHYTIYFIGIWYQTP